MTFSIVTVNTHFPSIWLFTKILHSVFSCFPKDFQIQWQPDGVNLPLKFYLTTGYHQVVKYLLTFLSLQLSKF